MQIIDIDGNEYLDFSLMGVGTNVLGYANKHIDNQVKKTIFEICLPLIQKRKFF